MVKQIRKFWAIILSVIACSCTEKEPEIIHVSSILLNPTSVSITEGQTATISATISPSNASNQKVIWSSSDATIATIDDGTVVAIAEGTAVITAISDDGGKMATCSVSVKSKTSSGGNEGEQNMLNINVSNVSNTSCDISISSSSSKYYFWEITEKTIWNQYGSEEVWNAYVASYEEQGALADVIISGDCSYTVNELKEKTEYVVFAAFCNKNGVKTSDIYVKPFKTTSDNNSGGDTGGGDDGGNTGGGGSQKPVVSGTYSFDGYGRVIISGYCNVENLPGASVSYGIMFSDTDLTTDAQTEEADEKDKNNKFTCSFNVRPGGETYYYRAYAFRSGEAFYGDIKTLTTKKIIPSSGSVIDMGLSVKWASCNLGATKPEGFGDYYSWAATEPFYENGYAQEVPQKHWKRGKSDGYTFDTAVIPYEFEGDSYETFVDKNNTLLLKHDAAHNKLGGKWRMPTRKEFNELQNECEEYKIIHNGIWGSAFVSKTTGNIIFLPLAGYYDGVVLNNNNEYDGRYWSSSLVRNGNVYSLDNYPGGEEWSFYLHESNWYYGETIRPVCE